MRYTDAVKIDRLPKFHKKWFNIYKLSLYPRRKYLRRVKY